MVRVKEGDAQGLSIIIVSWQSKDFLSQCLRSIYQTAPGLPREIIVVDNNSSDGTVEQIQKEFPLVKIISNKENLGFARANNQGIAMAQGQYLLLLNPDTVLNPEALRRLFDFVAAHPRCGVAGPQLLNPGGSFQVSCRHFPSLLTAISSGLVKAEKPLKREKEVDFVQGACMLIREKVIEDIGGLDESSFLFAEEIDYCWRARKAGWQVFSLPAAQVIHYGGQSTKKWADPGEVDRQAYISTLKFYKRHHNFLAFRLFYFLIWLSIIMKLVKWRICLFMAQGINPVYRQRASFYQQVLRKFPAGI